MRVDRWIPEHGWHLVSGQDESCLNIHDYSNGATPEDWERNPDYAEKNHDVIHVCNVPALIEVLREAVVTIECEPSSR